MWRHMLQNYGFVSRTCGSFFCCAYRVDLDKKRAEKEERDKEKEAAKLAKLHEDLAKDMGRKVVISGKSKVPEPEEDEEDVEEYNDDKDEEA